MSLDLDTKTAPRPLADPFGRVITYLRVSVTDRCDFRCRYCMAEAMTFLPKREVLSLEELDRICTAFVHRGVRKLRVTGGEPLVRRDVIELFEALGRHVKRGDLDELTLTTNASQLSRYADRLYRAGVRRVNVSLDTLDADRFAFVTRRGSLAAVLEGIDAAQAAGLRVKINAVALKGLNEDEFEDLLTWAHGRNMDLTLIETMPMGETEEDRFDRYLPLTEVRQRLENQFRLTDIPDRTGGPARYVRVEETGGRLGFISPLSGNFCAGCNRVRLTCTGRLYQCLGQGDHMDLRALLRSGADDTRLETAIEAAIAQKPWGHEFAIDAPGEAPALRRHMSVTGG